jgi:CHAT domain-containing protein/Tfp pilus assembly protein PilF
MQRLAVALLAVSLCCAQSTEELLLEGRRASMRGDTDQAQRHWERALAQAQAEKDSFSEGRARWGLGTLLNRRAQFQNARAQLERAVTLLEQASDRSYLPRVYTDLGFSLWALGDKKQAADLYRRALSGYEAAGDVSGTASALYNLAFVQGNGPEKSALIERALPLAMQSGDRVQQGKLLHLWGDNLFIQGDFAGAIEKLEQAAALLERARPELARVLTSLGRVYRAHGHTDRAVDFYRRALAIQEETGDRQGVMQTLDVIGAAYNNNGRPREALPWNERAVAMAVKIGSPQWVNSSRDNLAGCYVSLGQYARAANLLRSILQQGGVFNEGLVNLHLGEAYAGMRRYRAALNAANKAVTIFQQADESEHLLYSLQVRAEIRQSLGLSGEAKADMTEALRLIEQLRAHLAPNDFMKRGFAGQYQDFIAFGIDLLQRSGDHRQALEIAEQARARAFLDLLATRQTTGRAEPDLKSQERATAPSASEIAAVAGRLRSTLLAYWVGPHATFLWVVRPDGAVRSVRVAIPAQRLTALIRETGPAARPEQATRAATARGTDALVLDAEPSKAWRELYDLLIRPARHLLPKDPGSRLTIVPHGPLFRLSFAALRDETGRYLVESYTLHYVPAAAVLEFTEKKKRAALDRSPQYLLIADPSGLTAGPDGKPLARLPGSRREVNAIAQLLPSGAVTTLVGAEARSERVRAHVADKTVIHFATHAVLRDDDPFGSLLALSQGGRLTARDIYELDLNADLVVLSACRTGLGSISGDGVIGLTRAFFYAGTASIVATLWEVADEATLQLVPEFYRSLPRLNDKSRALRAAQLRLLAALRQGQVRVKTEAGDFALPEDPIFWAAFVLIGEP